MNQLPRWYYNEIKTAGVDYSKISEVEAYDGRMSKIRDIKKEVLRYFKWVSPFSSRHCHGIWRT